MDDSVDGGSKIGGFNCAHGTTAGFFCYILVHLGAAY